MSGHGTSPPVLTLGRGFSLPVNAVTEVISILATRGAGKSFGSADFIEELYAHALQFVVIDPMGVYWGLRSSYDGTKDGLKIIVLGGERGDVPLEPTSGKLIADVVVDSGQSFVLDLSLFDSKAEQVRFMEAFCERLFFRKGPIENRTPLMVVVDEADEFAPQKPEKNETKMLGHMIRLAKRGRTRGIGLLNLTQRSADFSKAVLDLSSAIGFMRTGGPRDRKAIKDWLQGSAPELIGLVDEQFPKLDTGEVLIYSPHWLKLDEPTRYRFRMIRTYDSYKTPEPGEVRAAPKRVAEIDLAALGQEIAATVERAKENDPAELRKRVRDLEARLAAAEREQRSAEPEVVEKIVEVPVFPEALRRYVVEIVERFAATAESHAERAREEVAWAKNNLDMDFALALEIDERNGRTPQPVKAAPSVPAPPPPAPIPDRSAAGIMADQARRARAATSTNGDMPGPQQKILAAVRWYEALGVSEPTRVQIALVAGYSHSSGGFNNLISKLNTGGYVIAERGSKTVRLTEEGRAHAADPGLPTTNDELQEAIIRKLPGPQAKLLREIIDRYPRSITREELAERTGYTATSGGYNNLLSKLRTAALIEYAPERSVVAVDVLFPMR